MSLHPETADFWVGYLAASIGHHLQHPDEKGLRDDYRKFLRSPLVTPRLREKLPAPTKGKR